ncbi:MAG: HAD family hydrolase [Anaerolineae bacterium]|nr:HAD family hydrolase [Anaerolineae bacterium]
MDKTGPFAQIKAVFFDLDGTLKLSTPSGVDALVGYMGDLGMPIDEDARRAAYRFSHEYWSDRDRVEDDMESLGPDSFWEKYIRAQIVAMAMPGYDGEPAPDAVREINRRFANEFAPVNHIAPDAIELLRRLRTSGLILGLVSNRPLPLADAAQRLGVHEYFDFTLAAGEIGSWKPDAGIFLRALEMAGHLEPQQVVYIGDNYYSDILGAQQAGLKAVFIDPLRAFPEAATAAFVINELRDLLAYVPAADHQAAPPESPASTNPY